MSDDNFLIGTSKLDGFAGYTKNKWFYLEPGDNFFRILPPVFSYAQTGQFSKFYAFHGGFKNSKGTMCMFQCIEEKDQKNKDLITRRCPVCDMVKERRAQYELAKTQPNVTKDALDKFFYQFIRPFEVQKKYFLNAVNQNNEIGVLSISYKAHTAMRALLKDQQAKGIDATGPTGFFLNFKKVQQYKGDRDTMYPVEMALEQDATNPGSFRLKKHTITPDFINLMKTQTRDLSSLYKVLTAEDLATLVAAPADQQIVVMDRLFGKPEQPEVPADNVLTTSIPNTTAQAVSRVDLTPAGFKVSQPVIPQSEPVAYQVPIAGPATPLVGAPICTPTSGGANAHPVPTAPVAAPKPAAQMTDAEFMSMFMPKK